MLNILMPPAAGMGRAPKGPYVHDCRICGAQFETRYPRRFTCSDACWQKNEKARASRASRAAGLRYRQRAMRDPGRFIIACRNCNFIFVRKYGQKARFCSEKCRIKYKEILREKEARERRIAMGIKNGDIEGVFIPLPNHRYVPGIFQAMEEVGRI